jgi:uncharacterized protein YhjY with autotransporter beta-barrel domain
VYLKYKISSDVEVITFCQKDKDDLNPGPPYKPAKTRVPEHQEHTSTVTWVDRHQSIILDALSTNRRCQTMKNCYGIGES